VVATTGEFVSMTDTYDIAHEEGPTGGRYVVYLPDGSEAEMTYQRRDAATIVADHTGVPPQYRGKGIAEQLVERAMNDARASGGKIVPVCSYVAAQFRRHPEWADLKAS
jgi:predicted GNAT family acetyltransferase